jgi:hypothetical protein
MNVLLLVNRNGPTHSLLTVCFVLEIAIFSSHLLFPEILVSVT